jgi:hypothetical protein
MAKKIFKIPKHQTGRTITTKTPYGTDSSMVVSDEKVLASVTINEVLAKDDQGYYITHKKHIDSKLADPNRYCESYRNSLSINNIEDETNESDDAV